MDRPDRVLDKVPDEAPAVVFPEPGKITVATVPLPKPESGDVIIKIEYSCISNGTERWCLTGKLNLPGEPPMAFPHVPGYQAAGTVIALGRNVRGIKVGDRVFSRNCKKPPEWKGSWWGGHMIYHVAEAAKDVVKLPDNVSIQEASALLIAQVGYNGAMKPIVTQGDVAVIIGEGLVGQIAAQVLLMRGARTIVAGLSPFRLQIASRCGASETYNNRDAGLISYIKSKFPDGVDIVVETASTKRTVEESAQMLKRYGRLVLNGYYQYPDESVLDWHWFRRKELVLHFPDSRTRERLEQTLSLIARHEINLKDLFTHTFSLNKAHAAFEKLLEPEEDFLGMLIRY